MAELTRVQVKKQIYEWAISESQIDFKEIYLRFKNIEEWINQTSMPTYRQLEELAKFLRIPFGYMFLDEPPKTNIIEGDYRTIGNMLPNMSKNLKDVIFEMSRKQDWISDYRKDNGWDKILDHGASIFKNNNRKESAETAKRLLELDDYWYKKVHDYRIAFNLLKEKVESLGIIVMQSGIVGCNTHRSLEISEFRGFMLYDEYAPLIFVNSNDSHAGRIFTLIHEYIHILYGESDIFIETDLSNSSKVEKYINKVTAEFLMPESHIIKHWDKEYPGLDQIDNLSKLFKVSRIALSIRLKDLGFINQSLVKDVNDLTEMDLVDKSKTSNGGNYWNTYKSRFSNSFIDTVIEGAETGKISYNYAFSLLNVKAKSYDVLKESMVRYE